MTRGGKRRPATPAAVSGPGALSARTDGGAANPILDAPSPAYGAGVALEQQASAAPLATQTPMRGAAAGGGGPARRRPPPPDLYGPTQRPEEPITAGAATGPGMGPIHTPPDDDEALIVMLEKRPNADLRHLLAQRLGR